MVSLTMKALRLAARASKREDALMIERGIGYWISPDGEFIPTPPRVSHADVIRELIDRDALGEDEERAFVGDANAYALSIGWTRVRIYPGQQIAYVDFGQHQQRTHAARVADLIDQLGLLHLTVKYTDAHGNYVSP